PRSRRAGSRRVGVGPDGEARCLARRRPAVAGGRRTRTRTGSLAMSDAFRTTTKLIAAARATLSQPHWDYIAGGALTETTMLRNRESIDALAFRPRVLHDVSHVEPGTTLLGTPL